MHLGCSRNGAWMAESSMPTKKRRSSVNSRYAPSSEKVNVQQAPRVRHVASASVEDLRIGAQDPDVYSRTASAGYLNSDAMAAVRKRRKRRKVATIVGSSMLVLALVVAVGAMAYMGRLSSSLSSGLDSSLFDALVSTDTPEDPFYVLLMGTDRSQERLESGEYGEAYRSDSIMLARLDPKKKKATIVSIPRDTQVDLGEYGTNKINAAHFYGGPTLAVQTVSELAGVPISHYAEIDFNGFAEVVDALGGVEVNVPIEIDDPEAGGHLMPGLQTLNGEQALILCRSRHSYDDYGSGDLYRAANQRVVLSAVAQKLLESDAVTIATTMQSLSDCILTDMGIDSIVAIAQSMRGLDASTDIYTGVAPTESVYEGGAWYEVMDEDEWKAMMKRVDAGKPPTEEDEVDDLTGTIISSAGTGEVGTGYSVDRTQTIRIRNGNGTDGVCADAEEILSDMGYRNFDTGNANSFDYEETLVVYKESKNADYAEQIVEALGCGRAVKDDGSYLFESDYLVVIGADWSL